VRAEVVATALFSSGRHAFVQGVNTEIWHRKESELWSQLGERIRSEEGRFLQKDSAKELAVGSWFHSARNLFALILWDCVMTWPEWKERMDG
jgi:hypothetical protein